MVEKTVGLPTYETLLTEAIRSLAVDSGTVTSTAPIGTNVLSDTTKKWAADIHKNRMVKIIRGAGAGQIRVVDSNIAESLLIKGSWAAALDTTSVYVILDVDATVISSVDATLTKLIPIAKTQIFNTALPAADNDILGAAITPTNSPSWLRIYVSIAVAGRLYLRRTVDGVTVSEDLNSGANLVANAAYCFGPVEWRTGDSVNLRYSATGGNILVLRIDEIGAAE